MSSGRRFPAALFCEYILYLKPRSGFAIISTTRAGKETLLRSQERNESMNHFRRKAVISAFGSLAVVLFLGSVRAGSCIISGSTERSCASETWDLALEALDARVCAECSDEAYESFDSRVFAWGYGNPLRRFKSTKPTGFTLLIR